MDRKQHVIETGGGLFTIISRSILRSDEWRVVEGYVLEEEGGEPDDVQDWESGGGAGGRLAFIVHPYLRVEG